MRSDSLYPNARFWVFENQSYVRLTLKPFESLSMHSGGLTDEGYGYFWSRWTYEAGEGVVTLEYSSDERDCDGRLSRGGELACPVAELDGLEPAWEGGERRSDWREAEPAWQRDESAEAMGY